MNPLNYREISRIAGVTLESVEAVVETMLKSPAIQVYTETKPLTNEMVVAWIFCEMYYEERVKDISNV